MYAWVDYGRVENNGLNIFNCERHYLLYDSDRHYYGAHLRSFKREEMQEDDKVYAWTENQL